MSNDPNKSLVDAERHGQRDSRRVLHEASDNYERMLAEHNRSLQAGAGMFWADARTIASGMVRDRLEEMAEFYLVTREAMESAFLRWRERRGI